jgi:hypothetical protein
MGLGYQPSAQPEAGGPPPVGYLWLLTQYIHSFLAYLEGVSCIGLI